MNGESLEEFYGGLLGVEWPWEVEEIIRDTKAREVRVILAYAEGDIHFTPPDGWRKPRPVFLNSCRVLTWPASTACSTSR